MDRGDWILGFAALGVLMAIGEIAISTSLPSPAPAAWAQALGTVFAILVASWVPFRIETERRVQARVEKRERSIVFMAGLLAPAGLLAIEATRVKAAVRHASRMDPREPFIGTAMEAVKFGIPQELEDAMKQFHNLDNEVVAPFRSCLMHIMAFNGIAQNFAVAAINDNARFVQMRKTMLGLLDRHLREIEHLLTRSVGIPDSETSVRMDGSIAQRARAAE